MPRLPIPGGDDDEWGDILNEFLEISLDNVAEDEEDRGKIKSTAISDAGGQLVSEKGEANGYASLDGSGKVPDTQLDIDKTNVGLGNVDNTSDTNKPVSTATQTALDGKASLSGATFSGAVNGTSLTLTDNLSLTGASKSLSISDSGSNFSMFGGNVAISSIFGAPLLTLKEPTNTHAQVSLAGTAVNTVLNSAAGAGIVLGSGTGASDAYLIRTGVGQLSIGTSKLTVGTASAGTDAANKTYVDSGMKTITNTRLTPRTDTTASSATPTINTDSVDMYTITALAANITNMTTNLSGTPTDGQKLLIRIKDNGTPRTITWGASFVSSGSATLLATTATSKTHLIGLIYDSAAAKWVCQAVDAVGY